MIDLGQLQKELEKAERSLKTATTNMERCQNNFYRSVDNEALWIKDVDSKKKQLQSATFRVTRGKD